MKRLMVAGTGLMIAATPAAAVDITGQSATAVFASAVLTTLDNPFVSPAVVGPGTEFSGSFNDVFLQKWFVDVDLYGSGFTLRISETTRAGDGNVNSGPAFALSISGLSGLSPVSFSSYSCASAGLSCTSFGSAPSIISLTSDSSSIGLDLSVLQDGETYVFAFDAVPEPASWAMLIAGFGLTGAAMRRRIAAAA